MSENVLSVKGVLEDPTTPASVLVTVLNDILTEDFLYLEIETIVDYFHETFSIDLPETNVEKIQTMQMVYTTNQFYMSLPAFIATVDALNNHGVDFNNADIPEPHEIAWAVTEVLLNVPEENLTQLFHPDIQMFIKKTFEYYEVHDLPPTLKFLYVPDEVAWEGTLLEDETILSAYSDAQEEVKAGIESYVGDNIARVVQMIQALPLRHRDVKTWDSFVQSIS